MKNIFSVFIFLAFMVSGQSICWACTPCIALSLEEKVKGADLIFIGQQIKGEWPSKPDDGPMSASNGWIDVKVGIVLKGQVEQDVIRLRSQIGGCAGGVQPFKGKAVIFLSKYFSSSLGEMQYIPIKPSCIEKPDHFSNKTIFFEDRKMDLNDFEKMIDSLSAAKSKE